MPDFKIHSETGVFAGYAAGSFALLFIVNSPGIAALIFAATYLGAIFPDIDSDSSRTVEMIFNIFSVAAAFLSIFIIIEFYKKEWAFFIPPIVYLVMKFGVSKIFKYFSRHRGIYHSIPMAFLLSIILFNILLFKTTTQTGFIISTAFFTGYFCHLLMDEINSIYDIKNSDFDIKRSLGTALTLKGTDWFSTIIVYITGITLVFISFNELVSGGEYLLSVFTRL